MTSVVASADRYSVWVEGKDVVIMTMIYDDIVEFAEVRLRCENTRKKSMCKYCPFYDRCEIDDSETLHVMCCEIASEKRSNTNE